MPRPTAAQLAYGSCTVIVSTFAMLLLSQTRSGLGITVVALLSLGLGLLVALTVPQPKAGATGAGTHGTAGPTGPARVRERRETVAAGARLPGQRPRPTA
jgi:hypothetical protein